MRNSVIRERRTHNVLSGKAIKVRHTNNGAIGKLNAAYEGEEETDSLFGGRWKAKREAKAAQKVRKRNAPTRKERKASKLKSKNKLRDNKGLAKVTRADAKTIKAEKGGGKIGDTIDKVMEVGVGLLSKKGGEENEGAEERESREPEKTFMQKNGLFLGIGVAVLLVVLFLIFKKK